MKKGKFLLLAGILGFAFSAASCGLAMRHGIVDQPQESSVKAIAHEEDGLMLKAPLFAQDEGEKKGGAVPVRQWEDKDTGFVIFGVLMGVSVIMIGTMVTLSILKKKRNHNAQEEQQ